MVRNVIGPEEGAELKRLCEEYVAAINHAAAILQIEGMDSPRFLEADKATGAFRRRIRDIPRHRWLRLDGIDAWRA